jgi:chloride channel 2
MGGFGDEWRRSGRALGQGGTSVHWTQSSAFFLVVLGLVASLVAWCIDEGALLLSKACFYLAERQGAAHPLLQFGAWCAARCAIVGVAVVFVHRVGPQAKGSGIPEMRTILNGFDWSGGLESSCLHLNTLVAKVVGLTLALGGGLDVGKEGPFVHTSCVLAHQMLQLPHFAPIRASNELCHHALSAACAVGVASTFGAPVGGVLFSIEVTSSFYKSTTYWKAFLCAISGCMVFKVLGFVGVARMKAGDAVFATSFVSKPFFGWEFPAFVVLAGLCGVLGALFTRLFSWFGRQQQQRCPWLSHMVAFALGMTVLMSAVEWPLGGFMTMNMGACMDDLFHSGKLDDPAANFHHGGWADGGWLHANLAVFAASKFVFAAASMSLPVPAGCVMPSFVIGAGVGRLFGEIFNQLLGDESAITSGGYAVVGAAAFCAAVTDTISAAVIVFEFTGQLHYSAPTLVAVLVSRAACRAMGEGSLFDAITARKQLPVWPAMNRERSFHLTAGDVMQPLVQERARPPTAAAASAAAAAAAATAAAAAAAAAGAECAAPTDSAVADGQVGVATPPPAALSAPAVATNADAALPPSADASGGAGAAAAMPPSAAAVAAGGSGGGIGASSGATLPAGEKLVPRGVVPRRVTLAQLRYTLAHTAPNEGHFSMVEDLDTMILLGVTERRQLAALEVRWTQALTSSGGGTAGGGSGGGGGVHGVLPLVSPTGMPINMSSNSNRPRASTSIQPDDDSTEDDDSDNESEGLLSPSGGDGASGPFGGGSAGSSCAAPAKMQSSPASTTLKRRVTTLRDGATTMLEQDDLDSTADYYFTWELQQPVALHVLAAAGEMVCQNNGTGGDVDLLVHRFVELSDSGQLCVRRRTPLSHVFFLFSVHKCMTVFVQRHGRLVGRIKLSDVDAYSSFVF